MLFTEPGRIAAVLDDLVVVAPVLRGAPSLVVVARASPTRIIPSLRFLVAQQVKRALCLAPPRYHDPEEGQGSLDSEQENRGLKSVKTFN